VPPSQDWVADLARFLREVGVEGGLAEQTLARLLEAGATERQLRTTSTAEELKGMGILLGPRCVCVLERVPSRPLSPPSPPPAPRPPLLSEGAAMPPALLCRPPAPASYHVASPPLSGGTWEGGCGPPPFAGPRRRLCTARIQVAIHLPVAGGKPTTSSLSLAHDFVTIAAPAAPPPFGRP
jgi:hypothetical protein